MTVAELFSADWQIDPYSRYERLREEGDGVHSGIQPGWWMVFRHADADALLRDHRVFAQPPAELERASVAAILSSTPPDEPGRLLLDRLGNELSFLNPPEHTRHRALMNQVFTPRAVRRLRPVTERIVGELLDAVEPGEEFDLVAAVAEPLPVYVIAAMLGVPPEARGRFHGWSQAVNATLNGAIGGELRLEHVRQAGELCDYLEELAAERARVPQDDLITALVHAELDGESLRPDELAWTVAHLLAAGNITTTALICAAVDLLIQHPDQEVRLRQNPTLVDAAIEEALRLEPPLQFSARFAVEDTVIGSTAVPGGSIVMPVIASANRDPRRYAEPDRFHIGRVDQGHLTFVAGIHYCIGGPLARMEGQVAVRALLDRCPSLSYGATPATRPAGINLRTFAALPLTTGPGDHRTGRSLRRLRHTSG